MKSKNLSRRIFLRQGCLTTAAIGLTICGGGAIAVFNKPKIDLPIISYGEKTMEKRVLIAYATKAGSTAEVAARIGEILSNRKISVEVLPVAKTGDISVYSAIVLGSAIRMGRILPEAQEFLEIHQAILNEKPFSAFVVCMALIKDSPETRQKVNAYLDPLRALVKPASEGLFAGVCNPSKVSLVDRLLISAKKMPQGDFRQWDQITAWAQAVPTSNFAEST